MTSNVNAPLLLPDNIPGLLPHEAIIFRAWWKDNAHNYTSVEFNTRLGEGRDPGPDFDTETRRQAVLNSQMRLDALLLGNGQPEIVEVKFRAKPMALGQLMAYRALYTIEHADSGMPRIRLLCVDLSRDMRDVLFFYGVSFEVVPVDLTGIQITNE